MNFDVLSAVFIEISGGCVLDAAEQTVEHRLPTIPNIITWYLGYKTGKDRKFPLLIIKPTFTKYTRSWSVSHSFETFSASVEDLPRFTDAVDEDT